ncbi:MAG TPA: hypothetical protein VF596_06525 [Pyrinomonadaceae bacterium]|jgi:hypothetical protein
MKKCPQCGQTYEDESLFFCLSDGASLASAPDPEATRLAAPPIPNSSGAQYYTQQPATRSNFNPLLVGLVILLLLMLVGSAAVFVVYQRIKEKPNANEQTKGTPEPRRSVSIPISPTPTLKSTPLTNTESRATPKTVPTMPFTIEEKARNFRVAQTSDGFTSVRAAATTKSAEKGRLFPGTRISCESVVKGEQLGDTNDWHYCPSVGGYVYSKLLVPES